MKRLILSVVLINLLSACAYFKPAQRTDKTKAEPAATAGTDTYVLTPATTQQLLDTLAALL